MGSERPNFLARRIDINSRSNSRPLACPRCQDGTSTVDEDLFFEHLRSQHPELAPVISDDSSRSVFVSEAEILARQQIQRTKVSDPPDLSKQSDTSSMRLNVGDTASVSAFSRPISTVGSKQQEARIENFDQLSLGANPLKRPATQSSSQEPKIQGSPKNRRVKGSPSESNANAADGDGGSKSSREKRSINPGPQSQDLSAREHKPQAQRSAIKKGIGPSKNPQSNVIAHAGYTGTVDAPIAGAFSSIPGQDTFTRIGINLDQAEPIDNWDDNPELLLQPETRPISHDQLVHEVKGIYAGLVMVEAKCIDVDGRQSIAAQERDPTRRTQLTPEQWSALIALHKTLLHEHHDFFLASQHPSASPALTKLAEKYSMPARMWKHGIHAFLEVLRLRLPASLDHMLAFIYIAYSMMALLYETVPSFEDTWIECLGDLGRYRMAIGDEDIKDRDVWSGVARFWYGKAANKNPQIGRLHHHLAILARPYTILQLSLYTRSLTAVVPFEGAKTSILSLFNPVFNEQQQPSQFKPGSVEGHLIKCLAFLYTGRIGDGYDVCLRQLLNLGLLNRYIERAGGRFKEIGIFICLSVLGSLLEFGSSRPQGTSRSLIRRAFEEMKQARQAQSGLAPSAQSSIAIREDLTSHEIEMSKRNIKQASKLVFGILAVALQRPQDKNLQPMAHAYLAFIRNLSSSDLAMQLLEREIPWSLVVAYLNHHASSTPITSQITREEFPKPSNGMIGRPLPEDFQLRGQIFMEDYYPATWFSDADVDDEERVLELPSMAAPRSERILWNGYNVAKRQKWMLFNNTTKTFEESAFAKSLPSPEALSTVDPSSMEAEALTSEPPMEDEKTSSFEVLESPPKSSKYDYFDADVKSQSPRKAFTNKPATVKTELESDVEMVDSNVIKQEAVSPGKPEYREWTTSQDTKSGAKEVSPFANVKHYGSSKASSEHIRIFDGTDPTEA